LNNQGKRVKILASLRWKEYYSDHESRPKCSIKGCTNYAHNSGRRKDGSIVWRKNPDDLTHRGYICMEHHEARLWEYKQYRLFKKDYCENEDGRLGFVCPVTVTKKIYPVMSYEVDHIDGNPSNWKQENLQTLCPICHGIKTRLFKDAGTPGRGFFNMKY